MTRQELFNELALKVTAERSIDAVVLDEVLQRRAENERLKAELAEVKKDAQRYAAVKGRAYVGISRNNECLWVLRGVREVKCDAAKIHGFDAAVDEIMKGK